MKKRVFGVILSLYGLLVVATILFSSGFVTTTVAMSLRHALFEDFRPAPEVFFASGVAGGLLISVPPALFGLFFIYRKAKSDFRGDL